MSRIVAKNIEGKIKAAASWTIDEHKGKIAGQAQQGEVNTIYLRRRYKQGLNSQIGVSFLS